MKREEALHLVDTVTHTYNTIADHFSQSRWKLWEDFVYFTPYLHDGQDILDVGCGNGRLVELCENKNISYTGVDISEKLIEQAQNKYGLIGLHPIFKVGSVLTLHEEKQYDVVFLIAVLQHIPKPLQEEAMRHVYDVIKPGGVLLMTNWNMWQRKYNGLLIKNFFQKFTRRDALKLGIPASSFGFKDVVVRYQKNADVEGAMDRYMYAFTKWEVQQILTRVGFDVEKNMYTHKEQQVSFLSGRNIVTIARKPHILTHKK